MMKYLQNFEISTFVAEIPLASGAGGSLRGECNTGKFPFGDEDVRTQSDTLMATVKQQWAESQPFPYLPSNAVLCRYPGGVAGGLPGMRQRRTD